MSKQDDIEFLRKQWAMLRKAAVKYSYLSDDDLLPYDEDKVSHPHEDAERCCRLAYEYALDGNVFVDPPENEIRFILEALDRQMKMIYQIISAIQQSEAAEDLGPHPDILYEKLQSPPTRIQLDIWRALDRKGLTAHKLASMLTNGNRSQLYYGNRKKRTGGLSELKLVGLVANKSGVGYFRPDAPPPTN